jgi:hypothetical protein
MVWKQALERFGVELGRKIKRREAVIILTYEVGKELFLQGGELI